MADHQARLSIEIQHSDISFRTLSILFVPDGVDIRQKGLGLYGSCVDDVEKEG